MVQYNPKTWFSLIFHAYSRQVFRRLIPALVGMGLWTAGVCYVEMEVLDAPIELSNVVHSLLGFVLSLFLVFRTNTAYDRWWEGRKQWGGLVNVSRTLATRVREFSTDEATADFFRAHIPGFVEALRDHLRPSQPEEPLRPEGAPFVSADHVPNAWAQAMERHEATFVGRVDSPTALVGLQNLERMVDILGACERILKTPFPTATACS